MHCIPASHPDRFPQNVRNTTGQQYLFPYLQTAAVYISYLPGHHPQYGSCFLYLPYPFQSGSHSCHKQFFPDIVDVDDVSDEATATKIVDTVNQILREIRTYRKLIAGIWPYEVGQPLTDWDRKRLDILIRFLDFDIVYPLLLAAVQLKQKTFADLVHMLEKFMFRHKSVCNLGHQKLSELYMQEAVKIRRDPENYRLTGLRTTLKEYIRKMCLKMCIRPR